MAVPPAVVTDTLCAPAVPAGVSAVIWVAETTTTFVAATAPTFTLVASVKFVPVMVIAASSQTKVEAAILLRVQLTISDRRKTPMAISPCLILMVALASLLVRSLVMILTMQML